MDKDKNVAVEKDSQNNLDLLGFDVKSAMALLGGNEELYITVLHRFLDQYRATPDQLLNLSIVTEKEELQRIAHTIKGLAATIGANDLQIKAKATEYAIRDGREPMLLTLSDALTACLRKIEGYVTHTQSDDNLESTATSQPEQKYSISGLLNELGRGRFIPKQELQQFEPILSNALDANSLAKTMKAIQTLDYSTAIQILQRVPN